MKRVIAILPAYNEAKRIGKVIKETKKYVNDVLVVDDGSSDNTTDVARKSGARVMQLGENWGVGFASRMGLRQAIKEKFEIIIFLDSDGQLSPSYINDFKNEIEKGADYVYGKRNLYKYQLNRIIGNWGLTLMSNILCPIGIWDTECGYRAMTLAAAKKLNLKAVKYEREMDYFYEVWRNKLRVSSVNVIVPVFHPKSRTGAMVRGLANFVFFVQRRLHII